MAAQTRESTRGELSLTTAEGDKVTLSFSAESSTEYAGYKGIGGVGSERRALSSAQVEVRVEGNLSRQELNEIGKLAKIMVQASRQPEKAAKAQELETIQSFAFSLNRTVERAYAYEETLAAIR